MVIRGCTGIRNVQYLHCLCIIADVTYNLVVVGEHVWLLFHQRFLAALPKPAREPLVLMDIFLQATWSMRHWRCEPRRPFPRARQRLYHELLLAGIRCVISSLDFSKNFKQSPLNLLHAELFITETEQLQSNWDSKSSCYIKKKPSMRHCVRTSSSPSLAGSNGSAAHRNGCRTLMEKILRVQCMGFGRWNLQCHVWSSPHLPYAHTKTRLSVSTVDLVTCSSKQINTSPLHQNQQAPPPAPLNPPPAKNNALHYTIVHTQPLRYRNDNRKFYLSLIRNTRMYRAVYTMSHRVQQPAMKHLVSHK